MNDTSHLLNELRNLRIQAAAHYADASEYLSRATHGTSSKRATDMGGTGRCPLTDYAERHANSVALYRASADQANAIWARVRPALAVYDYDTQHVIELYYNQGADMQDVARAVKRSLKACDKMQAGVCLTMDVPCFPKPSICRQRFKEIG